MGSVDNAKVAVAFVVVLITSFAVMNGLPADGLWSACGQETVLAVVALVAVGFVRPKVLDKCCTSNVQQSRKVCGAVVSVGAAGGLITLVIWGFGDAELAGDLALAVPPSAQDVAKRLALLLLICVLTAAFEESFMRALCIDAFRGAFRANGHNSREATNRAVVLAAILFALLHVGTLDAAAGSPAILQLALKFAQATLFALIMGRLYIACGSLRPCIAVHAAFDALYLGPTVVLTGALPATYASGAPLDTVLLTATVVLFGVVLLGIRQEGGKCR